MSVFIRAVLTEWNDPSFEDLAAFVEHRSQFRVRSVDDRGWAEFEALNPDGTTLLAGDLTSGRTAREELDELQVISYEVATTRTPSRLPEPSSTTSSSVQAYLLK